MSDLLEHLPRNHFKVILADPPWNFSTWSARGRDRCPDAPVTNAQGYDTRGRNNSPLRHYATMQMADIENLQVADVAAKDVLLFLWAVDPMIPHAIAVGKKWGFTFKTVGFYWAKTRRVGSTRGDRFDDPVRRAFPMGTGYWTRANPEQCLLFSRGKPKRIKADVEKLIVSPRREHSRKPDCVYERIERLVDGPYLELFARQSRQGWTTWGNEATKFDKPYSGQADFAGSLNDGYAAIRERVAAGGEPWQPGWRIMGGDSE